MLAKHSNKNNPLKMENKKPCLHDSLHESVLCTAIIDLKITNTNYCATIDLKIINTNICASVMYSTYILYALRVALDVIRFVLGLVLVSPDVGVEVGVGGRSSLPG